ncbi:hypothetical protein MMC25_004982 [Agyrium rufum]|nr:hypothetical protein [Agyrium rufum]
MLFLNKFVLLFTALHVFISDASPTPAAKSKPTVLVVCGAWHQPIHYTLFTALLEAAGYPVVIQANPSLNSSTPKTASTTNDANFVRNSLLLPLIAQGKEVLVVMHSYGGIVGAAAAYGLSKTELKTTKGYTGGGVVGLIHLTTFLTPNGASLLSQLPGQMYPSWQYVDNSTGQITPLTPKQIFYADVPPPLDQWAINALKLQSKDSFDTPSGPPAWAEPAFDGRRAYIHCLQDQAIVIQGQDAFVAASGVKWTVTSLNSSHTAFLSEPIKLTAMVISLLAGFTPS